MRTLITGGAGFVGSHLADSLLSAGHEVTIVDNLSTGSVENLPSGATFYKEDIRSPLDAIFSAVRPDVVFHLAAQVSVPRSLQLPDFDLAVNVGGTVNVLEAAVRSGARKFVSVSSAAVYGEPQTLPISEKHPTTPLSPYGLSKLTAEAYVQLLAPCHNLNYTIIRPANIYGPRQRTEGEGAVIPAFLNRFMAGTDPIIQGDGTQTRDFVYVTDMVSALIQSATHADGHILNVSTGSSVSVMELWKFIANLLGWKHQPVHGPVRRGDIPHSVMNNQSAQELLEWKPNVTLLDGLAHTIAWNRTAQAAVARVSL